MSRGPRINTYMWVHSCVLLQNNIYFRGSLHLSRPWTSSRKWYKCVPGQCSRNLWKHEPGCTALRGMYTQDHHGWVCTSEITLTRTPHYSRRGRVCIGAYSDVNAHTARFLVVLQLGMLQMGLHKWTNPQWGHTLQWEGTHKGAHTVMQMCMQLSAWRCHAILPSQCQWTINLNKFSYPCYLADNQLLKLVNCHGVRLSIASSLPSRAHCTCPQN